MKFSKLEAFRHGSPIFKRWWRILVDFDERISALESNSNSSGSNTSSNGDNAGSNTGNNTNEQTQQESQETPTTRTLSFTINDGTNPIEGATVVIGSTTKTTGSAGGCSFPDMADDTYSVEISKEGYTTKTESITSDETHTSFTISLVSA